jgi:hypothetical protein
MVATIVGHGLALVVRTGDGSGFPSLRMDSLKWLSL